MLFVDKSYWLICRLADMPCSWDLDAAILSRFQKKIYIPLPNLRTRHEMLELHLKKTQHDLEPEHINYLVEHTDLFSARDLEAMVKQAMQECATEFSAATKWKKLVPHPFRTGLEYALAPVVDSNTRAGWPSAGTFALDSSAGGSTTLASEGPHAGPFSHDGILDGLSAEQMLERTPHLLKHTILPILSVRHLRRAREGAHVTVTLEDLEKFSKWGGPKAGPAD